MKPILLFLVGCLTAFSVYAQNTVTINLNPNRFQEVLIDGKTYPVTSSTGTQGMTGTVIVTDLQAGQHILEVVRVNPNTGARRVNKKTFNLRSRYDLTLTVNNDGSVDTRETRNRTTGTASRYKTPMTDANFTVLLQNVQNQRRASAKTSAVTNAFAAANNYFTTEQAIELLEFVSSESKRFSLAKSVYPKITDPVNITLMYDLFEAQANKDAFAQYVSSYNASHPEYNTNTTTTNSPVYQAAMTDAAFNELLSNVKRQWLPGAKLSRLTEAFASTANYFTSAQARQLIQQVSNEDNRLTLAKSAYARIVDPNNFTQLYDLFTSQSRKDELATYVNSYTYNKGY
jgi:hypothetical protein